MSDVSSEWETVLHVVEDMTSQGYEFTLTTRFSEPNKPKTWYASFWAPPKPTGIGVSKSPVGAVTLARLDALRVAA